LCLILWTCQLLIAETRDYITTNTSIFFVNEDKQVVTLSLDEYNDRQGVIDSPDIPMKGLPYELGVVHYGFHKPYVFNRSNKASQAVLIPYMAGGGTGFAVGHWCLATAEKDTIHVEQMGIWHYHSCGPGDNYLAFDITPSFDNVYKGDLLLSFLFEERNKGKTEFIKGEVALRIKEKDSDVVVALEPHRVEDALAITALLAKCDSVREWAFKCLNNTFPNMLKHLKKYEGKIPQESIDEVRKGIKKLYKNNDSLLFYKRSKS
jgi:hypothetical protein